MGNLNDLSLPCHSSHYLLTCLVIAVTHKVFNQYVISNCYVRYEPLTHRAAYVRYLHRGFQCNLIERAILRGVLDDMTFGRRPMSIIYPELSDNKFHLPFFSRLLRPLSRIPIQAMCPQKMPTSDQYKGKLHPQQS
jgi:hypothetical protein